MKEEKLTSLIATFCVAFTCVFSCINAFKIAKSFLFKAITCQTE